MFNYNTIGRICDGAAIISAASRGHTMTPSKRTSLVGVLLLCKH
jgi:hypothetical protein